MILIVWFRFEQHHFTNGVMSECRDGQWVAFLALKRIGSCTIWVDRSHDHDVKLMKIEISIFLFLFFYFYRILSKQFRSPCLRHQL